jgi:hypothetical protein
VRVHRQWLRSLGLHPSTGASLALTAALSAAAAIARGDSADPLAEISAVHSRDVSDDVLDASNIDTVALRFLDNALRGDRDLLSMQVSRVRLNYWLGFQVCA